MTKQYDQNYFDRWYRHPAHRVKPEDELRRKVQMVLSIAEYHLCRPVASVLDVGCGEGAWLKPLRALRPNIRYCGLDGSDYVVSRFGAKRNLTQCRFGELAQFRPGGTFDLLICADVLHYVSTAEVVTGVAEFSRLCDGVAFIELFCKGDDFIGDTVGYIARTPNWYRKLFAKHGFTHCGNHCYLAAETRARAMGLELGMSVSKPTI